MFLRHFYRPSWILATAKKFAESMAAYQQPSDEPVWDTRRLSGTGSNGTQVRCREHAPVGGRKILLYVPYRVSDALLYVLYILHIRVSDSVHITYPERRARLGHAQPVWNRVQRDAGAPLEVTI